MIRDALEFWTTVEPYGAFPSASISRRLLPAIDNNQIKLFYRDGKCVGLVTWAYMTEKEFETREYSGVKVFARRDGETMVIIDMIAPHGKNDVLWMSKEMRKHFYTYYPDVKDVRAHRGKRDGSFPNKGAWHENAA